VGVDRPGTFRGAQLESGFERLRAIFKAFQEVENALQELIRLGYGRGRGKPSPEDRDTISKAREPVVRIVYEGERLLLYHRRLAQSDAAYGFLHQHEILEGWENYAETDHRIALEIDQLVEDTQDLITGFHGIVLEDSRLLASRLRSIPREHLPDFDLARDLFSVGFDEVGLLIAGRAMEGILRHIARTRRVTILHRGTKLAVQDLSFKNLIEAFYRIRFRKTGERVLSREMRALLDFVRELRNTHAHPATPGRRQTIAPREAAILLAEFANSLWGDIVASKGGLAGTTVQRDW
jgi:hypothetical protein